MQPLENATVVDSNTGARTKAGRSLEIGFGGVEGHPDFAVMLVALDAPVRGSRYQARPESDPQRSAS